MGYQFSANIHLFEDLECQGFEYVDITGYAPSWIKLFLNMSILTFKEQKQ